mgnify:FL=1
MPYKYTTFFESEICARKINESFVSKASLEELASLVPDNIDFEKNIDLLGVSFNAAVVNMFNKNGDGLSTETALAYTDQFIHKPTNIEHNKEKVVGHIVTAGFSDYGSNRILSKEEARNIEKPFNIALGAVVYKSVNKQFAELIDRSTDPDDESYYGKISTSWEVGFTNYVLAVGSSKLEEATIIRDPDKIKEMEPYLRAYGGSGQTEEGQPIYRLITGNIYPLGVGFTAKPAADVSGVYSPKHSKKSVLANDNTDIISQNKEKNVNKEKIIAMDTENVISELKELLVEKKFSEEAVASMTSNFADAIRESDEKYRQDIETAKSEKEAVQKEQEDLKSSVAELQEKLEEANERLSVFETEKKAEEAVARFNARMDELDSKFSLADEDREFLAQEIKSLDETEEAFASFSEKLEVLWKHKSNAHKEAFEAEIQARIDEEVAKRVSKASSEDVDVEDALDNAEQTDADVSNVNETVASSNESFVDKFKNAFSRENVTISR